MNFFSLLRDMEANIGKLEGSNTDQSQGGKFYNISYSHNNTFIEQ